jgi:hypothetical protein
MPFEVFKRKAAPSVHQPFVTVQAKGPLALNKAAFELLGEAQTVELLYDRAEQLIGIHPVDPSEPHAYPVRPQGSGSHTYLIAGQAFTGYYGIDTSVARRYKVRRQDDMLVIDLKEDAPIATGPRRGQDGTAPPAAQLALRA